MTIKGDFAIFRMSDTDDTEDTLDDKIEFDGTAEIPDNKSGIISFEPIMSRTPTENPAPFLEIARKPDTGFGGNRYTFHAIFNEATGRALAIARLRDWLRESNVVRTKFREGRFGIRNNFRPEFDLTPTYESGYKLMSINLNQEMLHSTNVHVTILLEFTGDPSELGA